MRERVAFSRSGRTSPLGKLDDRVDAFRIESTVKQEFAKRAAEADMPVAEFHREVMRVIALGASTVESMHSDRVKKVVEMLGGKFVR